MDGASSSVPSSAFHSPSSFLSDPSFPHSTATGLAASPFADPPISTTTPRPPPRHYVDHLSRSASDSSSRASEPRRAALELSCFSPRVCSCDVFVAHCCHPRQDPSQLRFVRWLRAELEMHGISCFFSDRRRCIDARAHASTRSAMDAATLGVVVLSKRSFTNPYSMEEIRVFLDGKKLVPVFFSLAQAECTTRDIIEKRGDAWERHGGQLWKAYGGLEKDWREAVNGLAQTYVKVEANAGNTRDAILEAVVLLGIKLGRRDVVEKVTRWKKMVATEEFPFPRNPSFVGRKKELLELELLLFGDVEAEGEDEYIEIRTSSWSPKDWRGGRSNWRSSGVMGEGAGKGLEDRMHKGKMPMAWVESEEEIEMQGFSRSGRQRAGHGRKRSSSKLVYGKGVACVTGDSGMGKTELLLEFAYQFAQRYKMILWVGGEARYLRRNYMKMLPLFGIDVNIENEICPEKNRPRRFEDMEDEAIRRVRKEMTRDIPFLLVIDNLQSEKDWWDGRNIMELLPRFSGQTHILISTRLPHIMNIKPLRLPYLSSAEAMSLMGSSTDLPNEDVEALKVIEERLGRLPLGLALVGAIFLETSLGPSKLLQMINNASCKEFTWSGKDDVVLRCNPFLVQLLDVCFSFFDHTKKPWKLGARILLASGWFAPSAIPISMLALAAGGILEKYPGAWVRRNVLRVVSCMCMTADAENSEEESSSMLVRFRIARNTTKIGCIYVHDVVKLYAQKRGDIGVAHAVVQALSKEGFLPDHSDHVLAVCCLLFKFGTVPAVVNLSIPDLMLFTKRLVLPLATHSFTAFSQCSAALELLRLSTEALELVEDTFLAEAEEGCKRASRSRSSCHGSSIQFDPLTYQEFALLRATLLETRGSLMLQGGMYDIAEQLCRTAVNIKEVIYGWEHPETVSTRQTMERLIRIQSNL